MKVERLRDLLKEKAFVDYFNMFLTQPIFGFRIVYQFHEQKFLVDSELTDNIENISNSKLFAWLESERVPLFIQSPMYFEYKLCSQLKEIEFNKEVFAHTCNSGHLDKTLVKVIVENIFGHYIGMQQFKKFLTETNGERIWQCLQDVMLFCNQKTNDEMKRYELHHLIMKYLANGTLYELTSRMKLYLFLDSDPLENRSMENASLDNGVCFDDCLFHSEMLHKEPDKAMLRFHSFLMQDMLTYWAPCFVLHLLQQRISFDLECLCKLSFTETTGSVINIKNLFDFSSNNGPIFMSEEANEASYIPKVRSKRPKLSSDIQEHLFGDGRICETLDSMNQKMMTILTSDKLSGYPFLKFLMQTNESNGDMVYMFWEDLCKYMSMGNNNSGEYVKRLQEMKIKKIHLLTERKSQDDLMDDIIKHTALTGFEMGDAEKKEKTKKLLKAADMATEILENLWQKFIDYEKNNMKDAFECQPGDEDTKDACGVIAGAYSNSDKTSMAELTLTLIDISQLKNDHHYSNNVLSCLFSEEETLNIALSAHDHERTYQFGKSFYQLMRSETEHRKRGIKIKVKRPKTRPTSARPFKKDMGLYSLKIVTELKTKLRGMTYEKQLRDRPKSALKMFGVNPYLSLRREGLPFLEINKVARKRLVFQKYLWKLCQFLNEMLQPYMKDLLTAYVDVLSLGEDFQETEAKNIEKYSIYKQKRLQRHNTVVKPPPIFFTRMKKKIEYLSDSLQFKRTAYMMVKSSKRTKINLQLKSKARRIITNFMDGALFAQCRSDFVFGCSKEPTRDIANDVALKLKLEGASCSLFHNLDIHIIPAVYQIWKRMGLDCINCGGRGKFLDALDIDRDDFDKKVAKSIKMKQDMVFEKPEKAVKGPKVKESSQLEEQASLLAKSLQTLVEDDAFWKYRRQFAYSIVECFSPDLRKLIQHRGGSQLEYVLVR